MTGHDRTKHYVIRGGEEGKERLQILSRVMRPTTVNLLNRAGLGSGMNCLDVGCGGGDVTLEMARWVGPEGKIVGIDIDDTKLRLAQQDAEQQKLGNVEFRSLDAFDLDQESAYDLVYARFLLSHLSNPEKVVRRMLHAARKSGVLVVEDIDFSGHFCYPRCRAFQRFVQLYQEVVRRRGGEPDIGPKLPEILLNSGLGQVEMDLVQPTFMEGEGKSMAQITLENISEALIAEGLTSQTEINTIISELIDFARNPRTIMSLPRIFQVWGYRK